MGKTYSKEEVIIAQNAAGGASGASQSASGLIFHTSTFLITIGVVLAILVIAYYINKYFNNKIKR